MVLFVYESALSNIPNKLFHRKNDNENQILTQDSHFLPKTVPKTSLLLITTYSTIISFTNKRNFLNSFIYIHVVFTYLPR